MSAPTRSGLAVSAPGATIDEISQALGYKTKTKKTKTLSGASVDRVLYLLSSFFKWAIQKKQFHGENPVRAYLAGLEHVDRKKLRTEHDEPVGSRTGA